MGEKIAVIGTGYVGLVSGACLAEIGHRVICADRDQVKINRLQMADMPIYEPGLEQMVRSNMERCRLSFTTSVEEAVRSSDIIFVAVGTPSMESGEVDMSQVRQAAEEIASHMDSYKVIVMKSTVPVGSSRMIERAMRVIAGVDARFDMVSNPEFLREGSAIYDTFHMDRIVIGADNCDAAKRIARIHEPLNAEVLFTDRESAELIKYASNAFLATKISFINEMANVCEKVGANIELVAKGMGMDKRIGMHFLQAGIGYGGSCFPKDTKAQLKIAEHVDYDFKILRSVIEVNQSQRIRFVEKVITALNGTVEGKRIAVMGLAFKPNTDDLRDAPALDIIRMLQQRGAFIRAYDPVAVEHASKLLADVEFYTDPYEAVADADAMVVTTEWESVKNLDCLQIKRLLRSPVIVDGRNVYEVSQMRQWGFRYYSIGR